MDRESLNEYTPDVVSAPGETLQEILDERHMTQAELAERTGRPKKTINEIVKGKTGITAETALQLERVLGVPASFWNNLERNYREFLARKEERALLESGVEWLQKIPVNDLIKLGWIKRRSSKADQVREVLGFFGLASSVQWGQVCEVPQASFRHSVAFRSDPGALAAWLRRGELEAQEINCGTYSAEAFEGALSQARSLTVEDPLLFVPQLKEVCAGAGVAVVFVREVPKCRAHGATRWLSPTKALIQLSLRYKTNDHLWFTFFHEAGHIVLHGKRLVFIEEQERREMSREEAEANKFAADLLIPPERLEELRPYAEAQRVSTALVQRFASEVGIAAGIVVGRLQHMGWLPYKNLNGLKMRLRWAEGEDEGA